MQILLWRHPCNSTAVLRHLRNCQSCYKYYRNEAKKAQLTGYEAAYSRDMGREQQNFCARPRKFGSVEQPGQQVQQSEEKIETHSCLRHNGAQSIRQLRLSIMILNSKAFSHRWSPFNMKQYFMPETERTINSASYAWALRSSFCFWIPASLNLRTRLSGTHSSQLHKTNSPAQFQTNSFNLREHTTQ